MSTPLSTIYDQAGNAFEIEDSTGRSLANNIPTAADVIAAIYPIGSIYISVSNTNPGTFLTGTTWTRLSGERFLLGAGDTYSAGSTAGSFSHTLVTNNLPSHNHSFTGSATNSQKQSQGHTHSGTTDGISANHKHSGTSGVQSQKHQHSGPNHSHAEANWRGAQWTNTYHPLVCKIYYFTWGGSGNTFAAGTGATSTVSAWHTHTTTTGDSNVNHTHYITTNGISASHTHKATASGTVGNTGEGKAFNIIPPYLAVYMWERTA